MLTSQELNLMVEALECGDKPHLVLARLRREIAHIEGLEQMAYPIYHAMPDGALRPLSTDSAINLALGHFRDLQLVTNFKGEVYPVTYHNHNHTHYLIANNRIIHSEASE